MKSSVEIKEIKVRIGNREIVLTEQEARHLQKELNALFGPPSLSYIYLQQTVPIAIQDPSIYPAPWIPPLVPMCGSSTDVRQLYPLLAIGTCWT